ncbi:MAG: type II toxin-antitoxin system PemK/MazF family toxin [Deltaproteobacteria bacterium]|nr:type II toxin-antitoxin system PemK/MazF family toxin [Deltaproteobacteria bacterium]
MSLPKGIAGNRQTCEVMVDQSRAIDNRRFMRKLKKLPHPILREVKDKLRQLAEL